MVLSAMIFLTCVSREKKLCSRCHGSDCGGRCCLCTGSGHAIHPVWLGENIPIIHIPTAYRAIFIPRNAPVRERSPEPGVLIRSLRKVQLDLDGCLNPLHIFVRDHARAAEEAGFADDRQLLQHGLARHDLGPCAHG